MAKVIDRRGFSLGGHSKRAISRITNIAVHYSATSQGHSASFERHWKNTNGWSTGGYHEVVLLNGDVELNYNADTISNGVGGQNTRMYNICYVGSGQPNARQLETLKERVNYNRKRFNLSVNAVNGHREYSGQNTSCPALNMNDFRKTLTNTGGLTVSQYNELKKLINAQDNKIAKIEKENKSLKNQLGNKLNKPSNNQSPTKDHASNFKEATDLWLTVGSNPRAYVTKEQLTTMLINLIDNLIRNKSNAEEYAREALAWAEANGISDIRNPAHVSTRQQVITIVYRAIELANSDENSKLNELIEQIEKKFDQIKTTG